MHLIPKTRFIILHGGQRTRRCKIKRKRRRHNRRLRGPQHHLIICQQLNFSYARIGRQIGGHHKQLLSCGDEPKVPVNQSESVDLIHKIPCVSRRALPHHVSPSLVATLDTGANVTFVPRVCRSKDSSCTEREVVSQKREAEGWTWGCGGRRWW